MTCLRSFHLFSCLTYSLLCLAWRTFAGRVMTWDHVHYHLYVAYAWWENRLPDELFAAGAQSYLNPLAHLPFHALQHGGASTLQITLGMALLHSVNLWLLHLIACRLISPTDRMRRMLIVLGVLLGGLSPGFLYETGSSYADVMVSIPALAALLLLLHAQARPPASPVDWRPLYAAGLLAGVAVGLKPSAMIFCVSLAAVFILLSGRLAGRVAWRALLAGTAGFALSGGGHAWMLWQAFGNPVFPLFNGVFRSPWFPAVDVVSRRFVPTDLETALRFPVEMASGLTRVGFENQAADIRPLWLLGLLMVAVVLFVVGRFRTQVPNDPADGQSDGDSRLFWLLLAVFAPLWLRSSGNIRYAVEALLLLGPAVSLLALQLARLQRILGLLAILLPLAGQTAWTLLNNPHVPHPPSLESWRSPWFDVEIPAPLDQTPALYLSLQSQSFASLAPYFPRESRFMNLVGGTTLPAGSTAIAAMEAMRRTMGLPLRSLFLIHETGDGDRPAEKDLETQRALLSEYGYELRAQDCVRITWRNGMLLAPAAKTAASPNAEASDDFRTVLLSCAVEPGVGPGAVERARRQQVDARIDRWAARCPGLFSPPGFGSRQYPAIRHRSFQNTDQEIIELATGELIALNMLTDQPIVRLEDKNGIPIIAGCPPGSSQ